MQVASFLGPWWSIDAPPAQALDKELALPKAASGYVDLVMQPQDQTYWCWAAIATSISKAYKAGSTWRQCDIAGTVLKKNCCDNPNSCNTRRGLDEALTVTKNLAQPAIAHQLSAAVVQGQIKQGLAIGCRVVRAGALGHFVVLHGFDDNTGDVQVADPATGTSRIDVPWNVFKSNVSPLGKWDGSYLTRKAP